MSVRQSLSSQCVCVPRSALLDLIIPLDSDQRISRNHIGIRNKEYTSTRVVVIIIYYYLSIPFPSSYVASRFRSTPMGPALHHDGRIGRAPAVEGRDSAPCAILRTQPVCCDPGRCTRANQNAGHICAANRRRDGEGFRELLSSRRWAPKYDSRSIFYSRRAPPHVHSARGSFHT